MSAEIEPRNKIMVFPEIIADKVARVTILNSDWTSNYSVYVHHQTPILIHGVGLYPEIVPSKGYSKDRSVRSGLNWWFKSANYYEGGISQSSQRIISRIMMSQQGRESRQYKTEEGTLRDISVIDQKEMEKYLYSLAPMPSAGGLFG